MERERTDAQVLKGLLDTLVLTVLRGGDNYGFGIAQAVQGLLEGDASILRDATLYPLLHRLESKGFVESYSKPGDRGTPRKYYRLTAAGRIQLKDRVSEWQYVASILKKVVLPREEL